MAGRPRLRVRSGRDSEWPPRNKQAPAPGRRLRWTSTPSSSAPASPASTSSTGCASSACKVRVFEAGTGVGGTWYWNRYPGAASIPRATPTATPSRQELLEEWNWSEHFARPAGDRALPQLRRRQVRPAPRHPVPQPRDGGALRRGHAAAGTSTLEDGSTLPRALPDHRHRPAVGADHAAHRGRRDVQGPVLPHRALAARAGELRRQARGRDRHRRHRRADHPGGRQDRRAPDRVPAHARTGARRCTTARSPRTSMAEIKARLPGDVPALPGDLRLLHPHDRPARHLRGDAARSARLSGRSSTRRPASASGRAISATC